MIAGRQVGITAGLTPPANFNDALIRLSRARSDRQLLAPASASLPYFIQRRYKIRRHVDFNEDAAERNWGKCGCSREAAGGQGRLHGYCVAPNIIASSGQK